MWNMSKDIMQSTVPAAMWPSIEPKFNGFVNAYGAVLFYEDMTQFEKVEKMLGPQRWADFKAKALVDSEHSNAMHQFTVWTALEAEGLDASLQHLHPIIDAGVAAEWKVPAEWTLRAQLVFGKPTGGPRQEKTFEPIEERVIVHKS